MKLLTAFLWAGSLVAQTLGPFAATSNFATDLYGAADTRTDCYGYTDSATWTVTFAPPAGYGVRIVAIHGDLITWIKFVPGSAPTPPESSAGVLLGLQSSPTAHVSARCDICADAMTPHKLAPVQGTTMLYIQDSVAQLMPKSRASYDIPVNQYLAADNKLLITVASWLNTTGKPIHIEPTFTVMYTFEPL